ncbi:MAG: hypothetical protein JXR53_00205 [Bacteroidales bacterium]|nr:hypothetical protein [Bacteroidales bacterium]
MRTLLLLSLFMIATSVLAQSGQYEVIAVGGTIKLKQTNKTLQVGDRVYIEIKDGSPTNLAFTAADDVIYLKSVETKKIMVYRANNAKIVGHGMITRGSNEIASDADLIKYFKDTVFILDADTLYLGNTSFRTDENTVAVLHYSAMGTETKDFLRLVGKNDTIILSHQSVFGAMPQEERYIASYLMESMELKQLFTDKDDKKKLINYPDIPPFKIIFLDDVIRYHAALGLNAEEIYNLLLTSYISLQTILNLSSGEEAEVWLMDKISTLTQSE